MYLKNVLNFDTYTFSSSSFPFYIAISLTNNIQTHKGQTNKKRILCNFYQTSKISKLFTIVHYYYYPGMAYFAPLLWLKVKEEDIRIMPYLKNSTKAKGGSWSVTFWFHMTIQFIVDNTVYIWPSSELVIDTYSLYTSEFRFNKTKWLLKWLRILKRPRPPVTNVTKLCRVSNQW